MLGKGAEADDFAGFDADPTPAQIAAFFADPVAHGAALLQSASTRFVYDLTVTPTRVGSIVRETHQSEATRTGTPSKFAVQLRVLERLRRGRDEEGPDQAGPGQAPSTPATTSSRWTPPALRWIGTGRTVLNNKGNPVKKYEPYFSVTHAYEDDPKLVDIGVTPVLYYDPMGPAHPNGPAERHFQQDRDYGVAGASIRPQ